MLNILNKFLGKHRQRRFKETFMKYYGKNYPVAYKDDYEF